MTAVVRAAIDKWRQRSRGGKEAALTVPGASQKTEPGTDENDTRS
jgi:hypothetical protein